MYQQNLQTNGGTLRDDEDGQELVVARKSQRGVTPPPNEAQIDHIIPRNPRNPDVTPGSNSYSNARIVARVRDRDKSNKRGK
jgi:filamentous hemagglutinin